MSSLAHEIPTRPDVDTTATDARVTATLAAPLACGESAHAGSSITRSCGIRFVRSGPMGRLRRSRGHAMTFAPVRVTRSVCVRVRFE